MMVEEYKKITVVAPVFNEEELIESFYSRLKKTLKDLKYNYEIIFVDDGSIDKTLGVLQKISGMDKNVKVVIFSRNFGHMMALSAGLDFASGDAVITMDSDLQHPPELIPLLIEKWEEGFEVVNTIRKEVKSLSLFKKCTSDIFYWILNRITNIKFPSNLADFRLIDKKVVEIIKGMKEHSRFLRGLISWVGYSQEFIVYEPEPRTSGKTKYSFFRMFSFAIDGITSFSSLPLRISTYFGLFVALFSSVYIVYAVILKILDKTVSGWASVLVAVLFMGGIQLVFLGIIGEYLARIYEDVKERPLYLVKRKIGFNQ